MKVEIGGEVQRLHKVGAAFTCCNFPLFTLEAMESVLSEYPVGQSYVVVDGCPRPGDAVEELEQLKDWIRENDAPVRFLQNEERKGAGRSLDRAVRALETPYVLTVDHGARVRRAGLLEHYVRTMENDERVVGVGMKRADKKCTKAFGPYVDPVFALWDRGFIVRHDLSFRLTHVTIVEDGWHVDGCSTAELLCYRALKLGGKLRFVGRRMLTRHVRHRRTPHTRGRCASPHELVEISEDELVPRRRRKDGSFLYPGGLDG